MHRLTSAAETRLLGGIMSSCQPNRSESKKHKRRARRPTVSTIGLAQPIRERRY
jgi:hypothetical protein